MTTLDFSPLFRSTVGFDRLFPFFEDALRRDAADVGYPPYNIEKTGEDSYRIVMAVAGFGEANLEVTARENSLVVAGQMDKAPEDQGQGQARAAERYLHRGIATRAFERRFDLADHIRVTGAGIENGLLHIELVRELPEAMKPRSIAIETVAPKPAKVLEDQAA